MQSINRTTSKSRGIIASDYLIDSSWPNTESYMKHLMNTRLDFGPFNYIQAEMSNITGRYSLYMITNGDDSPYRRIVSDLDLGPQIFGISNSDVDEPFKKVVIGEKVFQNLIEEYKKTPNKDRLVQGILDLLQNKTDNYPDETLAKFMQMNITSSAVRGVSRLNANYYGYWAKAHTRTSTIILVDYNDNVEYYEFNMTSYRFNDSGSVIPGEWNMNSFSFKLKPLYYKNSAVITKPGEFMFFTILSFFLIFVF